MAALATHMAMPSLPWPNATPAGVPTVAGVWALIAILAGAAMWRVASRSRLWLRAAREQLAADQPMKDFALRLGRHIRADLADPTRRDAAAFACVAPGVLALCAAACAFHALSVAGLTAWPGSATQAELPDAIVAMAMLCVSMLFLRDSLGRAIDQASMATRSISFEARMAARERLAEAMGQAEQIGQAAPAPDNASKNGRPRL